MKIGINSVNLDLTYTLLPKFDIYGNTIWDTHVYLQNKDKVKWDINGGSN